METGNVLVIGNSGVGKSTLINAVLGKNVARASFGTEGTTDRLEIYKSNDIPFRLIDSVGFEPSFIKERRAIHAVKKWSHESAKKGQENTQINVIWFCVDGTSSKLFPKAIQDLSRATSMWPSVPVVAVITKSYSVPDRRENIKMVHHAFAKQKRFSKNLKEVIPVVAKVYTLNDTAYAPPEGITELIDVTNKLMPEGIRAAAKDVSAFKLNRKRALSQAIVTVSVAGAAVVGAVPIPFSDAAILGPVEVAEVNAISKVYGIEKNEESAPFLNSIIQVGTVSAAAKAAISALKAVPGINIGAAILNAVVGASIVAALGEGSIYAFEQVYLGKRTVKDIDWVEKIIESKLSTQFIEKVTEALKNVKDKMSAKDIADLIGKVFSRD